MLVFLPRLNLRRICFEIYMLTSGDNAQTPIMACTSPANMDPNQSAYSVPMESKPDLADFNPVIGGWVGKAHWNKLEDTIMHRTAG